VALTPTVLLDGLIFPECPRWHDGRLWFCDVNARKVLALGPRGDCEVMLTPDVPPAGLGWRPDGSLLVVSTTDRRLLRQQAGGLREVADLAARESVALNDMVVDAHGRAYIGAWGFDLNRGATPAPACVFLVDLDGSVSVAADAMMFPNGMVITPDGRTLVVAETVARRLTAFDIAADGTLSGRRVWAELETFPDGICLDAEGAVWVAAPVTGDCLRVREGGAVAERVAVPGKGTYACMLGGDDRRTLYLCTAKTTPRDLAEDRSTGWIESVRVDVPGAGLP
jgi:sugar lactone lactonase YvrE